MQHKTRLNYGLNPGHTRSVRSIISGKKHLENSTGKTKSKWEDTKRISGRLLVFMSVAVR